MTGNNRTVRRGKKEPRIIYSEKIKPNSKRFLEQ